MLPVIAFPVIDPVLVEIGPFAIRWYALAYIAGIVIGWRLARRLVQWAPKVATPEQMDDYVTWVTLGIIAGGRLGYVLFYRPGYYVTAPWEALSSPFWARIPAQMASASSATAVSADRFSSPMRLRAFRSRRELPSIRM